MKPNRSGPSPDASARAPYSAPWTAPCSWEELLLALIPEMVGNVTDDSDPRATAPMACHLLVASTRNICCNPPTTSPTSSSRVSPIHFRSMCNKTPCTSRAPAPSTMNMIDVSAGVNPSCSWRYWISMSWRTSPVAAVMTRMAVSFTNRGDRLRIWRAFTNPALIEERWVPGCNASFASSPAFLPDSGRKTAVPTTAAASIRSVAYGTAWSGSSAPMGGPMRIATEKLAMISPKAAARSSLSMRSDMYARLGAMTDTLCVTACTT
mmetsp:Transcript_12978/g.37294  ORF Transcript_12978/g.37294 Transcript_12978/m.37294 type:complete len:265 (-) Transcript_12978:2264-3058(-)